jgi:hypothetical protein
MRDTLMLYRSRTASFGQKCDTSAGGKHKPETRGDMDRNRGRCSSAEAQLKVQLSALEYVRAHDYCLSDPEALLADRKTKFREAATKPKEVNKDKRNHTRERSTTCWGGVNEEPER